MRIAFISYEYPPDTADGGIATYVYQAARVLRRRGHEIEVFAASRERQCATEEDGIRIHRVLTPTRLDFAGTIAPVFAARNQQVCFDVLEGPDYRAEAADAVRLVPNIPLVVRLHTPQFLVHHVRDAYLSPAERSRVRRQAMRRRTRPRWNPYSSQHDEERLYLLAADEIVGISRAITEMLIKLWRLPTDRISRIPNPYVPAQALLEIPIDTCTQTISFLGRIEKRKGVLDLAKAIPLVLRRHPNAKFHFVGRSVVTSPRNGMDMGEYLQAHLQSSRHAVEFTGPMPLDRVAEALACTDICVFPSLWENFPYVCMEAMAAGRGVIGSAAGGMPEMLDEGHAGLLVRPNRPPEIARAILQLLEDPALRRHYGQAARTRVLEIYNAEHIGPQMEQSYLRAITRRQALGPRL